MSDLGPTTTALQVSAETRGAEPLSVPIYESSTFAFSDAAELARLIEKGKDAGFVYTRWNNPTREALEGVLAKLEGAQAAVSFASGMAAISTTLLAVCRAGDHVVSSPDLYGGTGSIMRNLLTRTGVDVTFASSCRTSDIAGRFTDATSVCYVETIGNPTCSVADLQALGDVCRDRGTRLIVDNTFASPVLCNPLTFGASVVVHSTTKYIGGHHDLTGGVALGDAETMNTVRELSVNLGGVPSPFDAWLALRGLATLDLRVARQCANAAAIATMLEGHSSVERVWYPGLASHPDRDVARRVLRGSGGMLAFELRGGLEAGSRFVEGVCIARMAASLGGVHTLVIQPAAVTHTQLTSDERAALGISDGLVRVSMGIEDTKDLLADFEQALDADASTT